MLTDLKRFCVDGCLPYIVDTTFQVAEKIWLTTSCYENEALIDCNRNHPHFPGPCQWQFHRNEQAFCRFAGELIIACLELLSIQKLVTIWIQPLLMVLVMSLQVQAIYGALDIYKMLMPEN